MKYRKYNSFIQYFNKLSEKKNESENYINIIQIHLNLLGTYPTINQIHYSTFKNESYLIYLKETNNIYVDPVFCSICSHSMVQFAFNLFGENI